MITAAEALMLSGQEDLHDRVQSILNSIERAIRNRSMFERGRDLQMYEMLNAEQAEYIRKILVDAKFDVDLMQENPTDDPSTDGLFEYGLYLTW